MTISYLNLYNLLFAYFCVPVLPVYTVVCATVLLKLKNYPRKTYILMYYTMLMLMYIMSYINMFNMLLYRIPRYNLIPYNICYICMYNMCIKCEEIIR